MKAYYYRIFDINSPIVTIIEGIVNDFEDTICPGQECYGSNYDLPSECELNHFRSKNAGIEIKEFYISRKELEKFFVK